MDGTDPGPVIAQASLLRLSHFLELSSEFALPFPPNISMTKFTTAHTACAPECHASGADIAMPWPLVWHARSHSRPGMTTFLTTIQLHDHTQQSICFSRDCCQYWRHGWPARGSTTGSLDNRLVAPCEMEARVVVAELDIGFGDTRHSHHACCRDSVVPRISTKIDMTNHKHGLVCCYHSSCALSNLQTMFGREVEALDGKCCEIDGALAGSVSQQELAALWEHTGLAWEDEAAHEMLVWDPDACPAGQVDRRMIVATETQYKQS
eukprot:5208084-Amphidinium_carterae.1